MIVTKKKMKKNYYKLSGGSRKVKPVSSPSYRMAKDKAQKIAIGLIAGVSNARITRQDYRTKMLHSQLIKEHFTNRTHKKPSAPLNGNAINKLQEFKTKLLEYKNNPNKNTTFGYKTTTGNFFTKLFIKPKEITKTSKFSEELKNMIKYMKAKETTEEKRKRYENEYRKQSKTTEEEYIEKIQAKLNAIPLPAQLPAPLST